MKISPVAGHFVKSVMAYSTHGNRKKFRRKKSVQSMVQYSLDTSWRMNFYGVHC